MAETLEKLRPDRDLQCYFQQPSAVAALSEASPTGFVVSGSWRQQLDWAVIEWNRDNVFEHPAFRNLPDGDLSGLELTYEETRTNCVPIDSDLYPTVEWPYLRIWRDGMTEPDLVPLFRPGTAEAVEGDYLAASVELELGGLLTAGDYIGLAWLDEQYNYPVTATDTLDSAVQALVEAINAVPTATMHAARSGSKVTLMAKTGGANWNRVGVYGFVSGARTESWSPWWGKLSGGASPTKWRIHLDFSNLTDRYDQPVAATAVRKMRWTYAAGWQEGAFERSEFEVRVSNWTVSGTGRAYSVAGPGSRRIDDAAPEMIYSGDWAAVHGPYNFSGGTLHTSSAENASVTCTYSASATHLLFLGAQQADQGAQIAIVVDGDTPVTADLRTPLEDALVRIPLGQYGAGPHTVVARHADPEGGVFSFDFLEVAIPATELPAIAGDTKLSLATDWDTYHSLCLAPERTAWMIDSLGFHGRVNHYVGAMWFYEMVAAEHQYASGQVAFTGVPVFDYGQHTEVVLGQENASETTTISHVHYIGDTAETVVKALALEINRGSMSVRAEAQGGVLTLYSRLMGEAGNHITIAADSTSLVCEVSGPTLTGGQDGEWRTDLGATPRVNRAARDWSRSFFAALHGKGLDAVAALSTELRHGDPSVEAGIAQRCPEGDPVIVSTPALQTNFSPASVAFWREAYRDLAQVMADAGMQPYVQFGEVQWWYFQDNRSGMPFYDAYTQSEFHAKYGRDMRTILENTEPPANYPEEVEFLPTQIGQFTNQVMTYVRATFPACRFEVLYPLDVNATDLNRAINYPAADWTPATLDCLKTESFGFTGLRDLDKCETSILEPIARGFPREKSAHLIGISDPLSPWQKEAGLARAAGVESVVLFALDQLCLVGHAVPIPKGGRRAVFFRG
jgi:hypothetical protein